MAKTAEPTVEAQVNPRNNLMHIRVSKPHGSKEDSLYIAVNGKGWQVMYDTDVYVPEVVHYHIMQKLRAEKMRDAKIDLL